MVISNLVTPLTRQTLSADVYLQLRDLLMNGRVMPGEQLSLRTIAEALGVSVMPVREAVHRLVAEQALELSSNRVLRVPVMTVSQFREITSIRTNLEGLATAHAATLLDAAALEDIEALHERFSREMSLKRPDGSKLIAANKELHFAIYRQARMPMLMLMIESLWLRVGPILNYDLSTGVARVREQIQTNHHGQIVGALKKKDAAAAAAALRRDIESAAEYIVSVGALVAADALPPPLTVAAPAPSVVRLPRLRSS
ncbi:GntR family transcriptional regulator [Ramlibacter sp. WS9]|uniref:GntR family transcriptional regulator n=1 Tax=Ramlibacter sp. WS9 TaxID=1882741 RepID=UPI001142BB93|nr:GntR family transcriptional regulator [Ramlibacter sp. WS9]ROZ75018.1 GntR family transcriptional regulator [Ramlibacter sp. WS9]